MRGANFLALDVETANQSPASICQVGGCVYVDGEETDCFSWLINPEADFHPRNVAIHGITESDTARQAAFRDVQSDLIEWMEGTVVLSHGSFDRTALTAAFNAHGTALPSFTWVDSCELVKAAWPEFSSRGYGLKPTAERLGIQFDHHDALQDARTAGLVAIAAITTLNLPFGNAVKRYGRPFVQAMRSPLTTAKQQTRDRERSTIELKLPPLFTDDQMELLACYASMPPDLKRVYLAAGRDALERWNAAAEQAT